MGKSLASLKEDFAKQLEEAATQISKLLKDIEALKVRQNQLIGAVYAVDLAIHETESKPEIKEEKEST